MDESWSDAALSEEIGRRLQRERLNRNLSQGQLAERAGVSRKAVAVVESGGNPRLSTITSILRALGLVGRLDAVFPEPGLSPIDLAKRRGQERERATGTRSEGQAEADRNGK